MKRSKLAPPDAFSLSPLKSLLPVCGDISKLEAYSTAFFARHEQVNQLLKEAESGNTEAKQRYRAEEAMLRQLLEWSSKS